MIFLRKAIGEYAATFTTTTSLSSNGEAELWSANRSHEHLKTRSPLNTTATLVSGLWNYCSILRDDGLSYGELASHAPLFRSFGRLRASRTAVVEQLTRGIHE